MKTFFQLAMMASTLLYFSACTQSPEGQKAKTGDAQEITDAAGQELNIDLTSSKIEWVGNKVGGSHNGVIGIKSGTVKVEGGKLVGGNFVIDVASIEVLDIDENSGKGDLEGHLKNEDFFEVEKFPEGKFEIASVEEKAGEEGATHLVKGNLTLKGVTKGIEIPAKISMEEGMLKATTPQFLIDRQQFGISYQNALKEKAIDDNMGIKITLAAKAS